MRKKSIFIFTLALIGIITLVFKFLWGMTLTESFSAALPVPLFTLFLYLIASRLSKRHDG